MTVFKKLFITDWLIIIYCFFTLIWIALGNKRIDTPDVLFIKYLCIIVGVFVIAWLWHWTKNPLTQFIRFWYPFALLVFFYTTITLLHGVVFGKDIYLDYIFQDLDKMIFGYQPAEVWGDRYDFFVVQELFHFAYFSYYLMLIGIPLYVYITKSKAEFVRMMFNVMFVFIACYIVYMILPVVGGRMLPETNVSHSFMTYNREMTETYRHGIFTYTMAFIYRHNVHWGGAFPSSHVAVALVFVFLSFRYCRSFSLLLIITFILLAISTVYCHYHYFVDVIAGIIYGFIMFVVSEVIYTLVGLNGRKYIDI